MQRQHLLFILVTLSLSASLAGCGNPASAASLVKILPDICQASVGQQIPLTLDGIIPPNATINWEVSDGGIAFTQPGLNALFTAPLTPTIVTVSVSITSGTPGVELPITRQCTVLPLDATPTVSTLPSIDPDPKSADAPAIVISEVMADPCGGTKFKKYNEYVELYNNGNQPVDVRGWWLYDGGNSGTPDALAAWDDRQPDRSPGDGTVTNATVIPPHRFAVVLSPIYVDGEEPYHMPYSFPSGTIILTVASSDSLGDDYFNIIGDGSARDPVVLYIGSDSIVDKVISTYGSPILSKYVHEIRDDYRDNIPLDLHACGSAERVNPSGKDVFDNWHEVKGGSPGDAPY